MDFHDRRTGKVNDATGDLLYHMQAMHQDALDFSQHDMGGDIHDHQFLSGRHATDHDIPLTRHAEPHGVHERKVYDSDTDSFREPTPADRRSRRY